MIDHLVLSAYRPAVLSGTSSRAARAMRAHVLNTGACIVQCPLPRAGRPAASCRPTAVRTCVTSRATAGAPDAVGASLPALPADSGHLLRCHRCIERNPVRATIATGPAEYRGGSDRTDALGRSDRLRAPHAQHLAFATLPDVRQRAYRDCVGQSVSDHGQGLIRRRLQCPPRAGLGTVQGDDRGTADRGARPQKVRLPRRTPPRPGRPRTGS